MLCYFFGSIKIEEEVARHLDNRCGAMAVAGECPQSNILPSSLVEKAQHCGYHANSTYRRNLQLIVLDPDMSPAPDGDEDFSGSVKSAVDCQAPAHQVSGAGEDKLIHQVRRFPTDSRKLQYPLPKENDTQTGKVEMSNHSNVILRPNSIGWFHRLSQIRRASNPLCLPLVEASSIDAVSAQWLNFQLIGNCIFRRQFMYHREGTIESLEPGLVRRTAGPPS
ncbi:hypothetical protein N7460_007694 [Penicillium canescens]|uniref:Uncharacterized protein n=1 Tax=Penicillium canescens TaxID=5083 RepID=A0AAD6N764_PENCN|nr:hypothetical protein N7460_007694 [Penicillium canescens]